METKLTLRLEQGVIEGAKIYSKTHHRSLSSLVEAYFRRLGNLDQKQALGEITPVVKLLSGVLQSSEIENWKEEYSDWLKKKHE